MLTYKKYTTNTARAGTVFSKAGCTAAYLFVGIAIVLAGVVLQPHSAFAADISVTPITWDIIGLDSNDPQTGPNQFPVGVRVCNNSATEDATDVIATFNWTEPDPHPSINLRAGTDDILQLGSVPASECVDAYYEAEVVRDPASFDTMRNYFVKVISTSAAPASSPIRQLYVEHLISQNRNATTDVLYGTDPGGLTSVEPGGTLSMMVGGTYYIKLVGSTATQGYNQLETFINIPNTIFRILEVTTDYTADTSATVGNPNDKLYGNGCLWENNINSENLRSCLSTGKVGGGTEILYKVEILQMPGAPLINPEPIQTLYYDFSGSSYHYNADYSLSTRYIEIINASIQKSFDPKVIAPGGTSKITFTITNPGPDELTGVKFDDDSASTLPGSSSWPTGVTVASTTVGYNGCDASSSPTPSLLTVGDTSVAFDNISIAGFGTCTIELDVTVAADGTYTNTTSHLLINGSTDTESYGEDSLTVVSGPPGATGCAAEDKVVMATWDFSNATQTAGTEVSSGTTFAPLPATDPGDVGTPTATVYTNATNPPAVNIPSVAGVVDSVTSPASFGGLVPDDSPVGFGKSIGILGGWLDNYTASPVTVAELVALTDGATANEEVSFFEFRINAAHYADIEISMDYDQQGHWNNREQGDAAILASMDGGTSWEVALIDPATDAKTWDNYGKNGNPLTAVLSGVPTGEVIFRVLFAGAGNGDAATFIDNVTVSGCPSLEYPTLEKNFPQTQFAKAPPVPFSSLSLTRIQMPVKI